MSVRPGRNNAKIINKPTGGGNKKQGLTSTTNKSAAINSAIQHFSWGRNRDRVYCMNQLGGIGRGYSQFSTNADGPNCKYYGVIIVIRINHTSLTSQNDITALIKAYKSHYADAYSININNIHIINPIKIANFIINFLYII